jgi:flavin-dependent dehydrogenase
MVNMIDANQPEMWDAIIIGGGPTGSVAGIELARRGRRAIILEKAKFPRFHVGESLLPATLDLIKELGLEPALRSLPHVKKFGADFALGGKGIPTEIDFSQGYCKSFETFNIERSLFDAMLLRGAENAGVRVCQGTGVREIVSLADGDVRVRTDAGEIRGRYLLDASGQGCVVGRHLGTRQSADESYLRKVAYFNHFQNVSRADGPKGGNPLIVMMEEGWFWLIPITEDRTSIGMVLDADTAKRIGREEGVPPDRMLAWGLDRCPAMLSRLREAIRPETNNVAADYSYRCRPYAGEGYFLVGDAAAFMDPIFSTGIFVGTQGAMAAAKLVDDILADRLAAAAARKQYCRQFEQCTDTLFKLIGQYYDHSFRELFLQGSGPLAVHRAVIGVLAGNVFPRPPMKLRWRLWVFDQLVKLNRRYKLVPRRRRFSLLKQAALLREEAAAAFAQA